jgi:hypothetical protein
MQTLSVSPCCSISSFEEQHEVGHVNSLAANGGCGEGDQSSFTSNHALFWQS